MWQPDGHTLEQMEAEVNKDDTIQSVYQEYTLDFQTALIFVPLAAANVRHEHEPEVLWRRLQEKRREADVEGGIQNMCRRGVESRTGLHDKTGSSELMA